MHDNSCHNIGMTYDTLSDAELFRHSVEALRLRDAARAARMLEALHLRLPAQPEVLINLALAYEQQQDYLRAESTLQHATRLAPHLTEGWANLGNILRQLKRADEALATYSAALHVHPKHREARLNRIAVQMELRRFREALTDLTEMISLGLGDADVFSQAMLCQLQLAEWKLLPAYRASLAHALKQPDGVANPFRLLCIGVEHDTRTIAERWTQARYALPPHLQTVHSALPRDRREDRKLHIGYISSDFHNHATAHLLGDFFAQHDAQQFSVFVYSMGKDDGSAIAQRLRSRPQQWRDVMHLSAEDIAKQIRADSIDILVDLKGYTQRHAMRVMAQRPAPIQMHYLGYPCTTGADFIDYLIADDMLIPPEDEGQYTETILRLPGCYQINDPKRPLPQPLSRRDAALPENALVFAAFNATYKIQPEMFACWMRILGTVPGSVLWLQSPLAAEAVFTLRATSARQGVEAERLIFAPYVAQHEHISRLALADVFLDCSPVSGHTTASDALWAGIPVVSLKGSHFIGRVAASLSLTVGVSELVADSLEEYEAQAIRLAQDGDARTAIRNHLIGMRLHSPFDGLTTIRGLEQLYLSAASRFTAEHPLAPGSHATES